MVLELILGLAMFYLSMLIVGLAFWKGGRTFGIIIMFILCIIFLIAGSWGLWGAFN